MTIKEIQDTVIDTLAIILDMKRTKISLETNARSLANWDSLNQIKLTVALEEEFDLEFEPEEIAAMTSIKAIVDTVSAKVNN